MDIEFYCISISPNDNIQHLYLAKVTKTGDEFVGNIKEAKKYAYRSNALKAAERLRKRIGNNNTVYLHIVDNFGNEIDYYESVGTGERDSSSQLYTVSLINDEEELFFMERCRDSNLFNVTKDKRTAKTYNNYYMALRMADIINTALPGSDVYISKYDNNWNELERVKIDPHNK